MTLKIATWNVNSIRKRLDHLCNWLINSAIDIALLQEIKCTDEQFPFFDVESLGYKCYVHGQKARNGVAIITRYPIVGELVTSIFSSDYKSKLCYELSSENFIYNCDESRYLECVVLHHNIKIRIASIYVPNGQSIDSDAFQYKLGFFDQLREHALSLLKKEEILILGGDYNVAPYPIDVYDPEVMDGKLCFHKSEREKFRSILNLGFTDSFRVLNDYEKKFSWWNYKAGAWQQNRGLRIDNLLLSPQATDKLLSCVIHDKLRGLDTPSDHAPVVCELDLSS
ncbi:exodeoxyribonuclease III [Ehrlichia chaffeensis str. Liberty]|uniref:Exodeoxyribonuclease III n=1 Tax=Ehrlichia chaffeensis (strain ATCC CRL-10679 / Arkansas) TaxID=205920 RepID=Q2GGF1_EHRCR|nr:exodeoxyribonuclease III [Ehrlichia chaffeensis]ABD44757.1 exodeoxyribonuclease III [Ehrlichia chaffeensis str. Arkansas]AHX05526.1 exodeoxyribonuclease III [Ehrlichia chaffeensis str. Jax]AHX06517.1 exodeoxyribonuclease III [Ehrlichia chaffeensis str. Liberty]AHX07348.1 exodeoxyribonuclease III [Ehrlichia chaffeensis str. Osceola]AHX08764.1 exodeoxyribonuclease III [Ehrlichia chaffeensis str. Saint Vincent]